MQITLTLFKMDEGWGGGGGEKAFPPPPKKTSPTGSSPLASTNVRISP